MEKMRTKYLIFGFLLHSIPSVEANVRFISSYAQKVECVVGVQNGLSPKSDTCTGSRSVTHCQVHCLERKCSNFSFASESLTCCMNDPVLNKEISNNTDGNSTVCIYRIIGILCPPDYILLPTTSSDMCIKFHDISVGKDYAGRQAICHAEGATLVKIDSAAKQTALAVYLGTFVTDTVLRIVIQGQEELPSGIWRYDDGTLITYTYWRNGQPNSASDNCIGIRHSDYEWRDISCTIDAACVCEISLT